MKITKSQLNQLIKEEIKLVQEAGMNIVPDSLKFLDGRPSTPSYDRGQVSQEWEQHMKGGGKPGQAPRTHQGMQKFDELFWNALIKAGLVKPFKPMVSMGSLGGDLGKLGRELEPPKRKP
jgi:hypothetical protein